MTQRPYILAETDWKTVEETDYEVVVLPWGATEAHNLHLPYATDIVETDRPGEFAIDVNGVVVSGSLGVSPGLVGFDRRRGAVVGLRARVGEVAVLAAVVARPVGDVRRDRAGAVEAVRHPRILGVCNVVACCFQSCSIIGGFVQQRVVLRLYDCRVSKARKISPDPVLVPLGSG